MTFKGKVDKFLDSTILLKKEGRKSVLTKINMCYNYIQTVSRCETGTFFLFRGLLKRRNRECATIESDITLVRHSYEIALFLKIDARHLVGCKE